MKLYLLLSKISFLKKSYTKKFLFVAFLGIHIPLIGLIMALVFFQANFSPLFIIVFTLVLTLVATFITLFVIHGLIQPINNASQALINYEAKKSLSNLPLHYEDEAGLLMANVQNSIKKNDAYLNQKQDLIYLLAHDLKNFASQPKMIAQLMLEEDDAKLNEDYSNLIIESAKQQLEFIETIISILNQEDEIEKIEVKTGTVALQAILSAIEKQLEIELSNKNITLKIVGKIDEVIIQINKILLTRILYNLIYNAFKFSYPDGTIQVTVEKEAGFLIFKVEDSGIGFDNSKKDQLFNKFSALGRLGTNDEKTTGVGLYLCHQLVKKYNGSIDAFSAGVDKGATFTVKFELF